MKVRGEGRDVSPLQRIQPHIHRILAVPSLGVSSQGMNLTAIHYVKSLISVLNSLHL